MLNEKVVKQFFLETTKWKLEENPTPIFNTHFPHSRALLYNNGCLYYVDVWAEVEEKNIVQTIGHVLIWRQPGPLWGINYDGWYEGGEEIYALGNELLIKALLDDESFGSREINRTTEDKRLLYKIEVAGRFQLFEIKITITPNDRRRQPIFRFTYRGRALVSLSS